MVHDKLNREVWCGRFQEQLELAGVSGNAVMAREELLAKLPAEVRGHADQCANCQQSLEDVLETRNLLQALGSEPSTAEPGPWFSSKVMNAIAAQEREIESSDGVWISVRRLAPRLAAVCALLLVLMGTWVMRTQREYQVKQMAAGGESVFESASSGTLNDEVLTNAEDHR
jgi:hypothetical protein